MVGIAPLKNNYILQQALSLMSAIAFTTNSKPWHMITTVSRLIQTGIK